MRKHATDVHTTDVGATWVRMGVRTFCSSRLLGSLKPHPQQTLDKGPEEITRRLCCQVMGRKVAFLRSAIELTRRSFSASPPLGTAKLVAEQLGMAGNLFRINIAVTNEEALRRFSRVEDGLLAARPLRLSATLPEQIG